MPASCPTHGLTAEDHCDEVDRLKSALGRVAELGDRCEECEPTEAPYATHVAHSLHTGVPIFLCPTHADEESLDVEVEPHEQDAAVQVALDALGIKVGEPIQRRGGA